MALIAVGYITLRAERKHGLIDPYDDSVDLMEVAFSLPTLVIAVSVSLFGNVVLVIIDVRNPSLLAHFPSDLSILQLSLVANGFLAILVALFTLQPFVTAAYLLIRKPLTEFQ